MTSETPKTPEDVLREALGDFFERWDNEPPETIPDAVEELRAALAKTPVPRAPVGELDVRVRKALDLADYRLGQLLGNTDFDDEALQAVRSVRIALSERRYGETPESGTISADERTT